MHIFDQVSLASRTVLIIDPRFCIKFCLFFALIWLETVQSWCNIDDVVECVTSSYLFNLLLLE